jgi:hypothetical protein
MGLPGVNDQGVGMTTTDDHAAEEGRKRNGTPPMGSVA